MIGATDSGRIVRAFTRSPYRVSFAGGGTDLPAFFRHEEGAVLNTAIEASIYVRLEPRDGSPSKPGTSS